MSITIEAIRRYVIKQLENQLFKVIFIGKFIGKVSLPDVVPSAIPKKKIIRPIDCDSLFILTNN